LNRTGQEVLVAELLSRYNMRREAIRSRLDDFRRVRPSEYFYEMAYCLLTPQSSAENAGKVIDALQKLSFHDRAIDPEALLRDPANYIRFHRTKARHLLKLKSSFSLVAGYLQGESTSIEQREWLVRNVHGLGYKEATHFLRNVGRNGGLAILDRHILRNLKRYGAIRSIPKSLSRKQYLAVEQRFMKFADHIGIPLDELDLLFWSMETGVIRK